MQYSSSDLQASPLLPWLFPSSPNYTEHKFTLRLQLSSHRYEVGREHQAWRRACVLRRIMQPPASDLRTQVDKPVNQEETRRSGLWEVKPVGLHDPCGVPAARGSTPQQPSTQAGKAPWLQGSPQLLTSQLSRVRRATLCRELEIFCLARAFQLLFQFDF